MKTLGYQKSNEKFITMKSIFRKFSFVLRDLFSLIFKSKDSF